MGGGIGGTQHGPDGEAREAEGVAGAAERGEDGGLERRGGALGDGPDRVGVSEGGRDGHGGRGQDGERQEEDAAVGHFAGGWVAVFYWVG